MLDQEFRVDEAYSFLVSGRPSKILSGWSYEANPKSLRSSRTAGEYQETDVAETEDEGNSPEYKEFCNLLLDGQKIANRTDRTHVFIWRGYKACISSKVPKVRIFYTGNKFLRVNDPFQD